MRKVLLSLSVAYLVLLVVCIGSLFLIPVFPTFMEGEQMARGCFLTEAVLAGPSCHGFPGSSVVALSLQWPFHLVLLPVFGLGAMLADPVRGTLFLGVGLALWVPLVYLFRATRPGGERI